MKVTKRIWFRGLEVIEVDLSDPSIIDRINDLIQHHYADDPPPIATYEDIVGAMRGIDTCLWSSTEYGGVPFRDIVWEVTNEVIHEQDSDVISWEEEDSDIVIE